MSLYQLDSTLPATVSLQSPSRCTSTGTQFYRDVTDCWLPEWSPANGGKVVYVVVNGSTTAPALVPPVLGVSLPLALGIANPFVTALTTSAYPGQCPNFGVGHGGRFVLGSADDLQSPPLVGGRLELNERLRRDGRRPGRNLGSSCRRTARRRYRPTASPRSGRTSTAAIRSGRHRHGPWPLAGARAPHLRRVPGFIVSGKQIRPTPSRKIFVHVVDPGDSSAGIFVTSPSCGRAAMVGPRHTYPAPSGPSATLAVSAAAGRWERSRPSPQAPAFSTAHVRGQIIGNTADERDRRGHGTNQRQDSQITQAFSAGGLSPANYLARLRNSLFALAYVSVRPSVSTSWICSRGHEWPANQRVGGQFVSLVPAQTLNCHRFRQRTARSIPTGVYGLPRKACGSWRA